MALRPVVVTGLGIICAAGRDPAEFWRRLTTGQGGLTPVLDEAYAVFEARHAGQVPEEWITSQLPAADAGLDRTAKLALVAARQALTQAAGQAGTSAGVRAGVQAGTQAGGQESARAGGRVGSVIAEPGRFGVILGKCQATPDVAGRYQPMHRTGDVLAERLELRGPRILVSTACAAGGNAVGLAMDKILTGEADAVLAGGVDPLLFGTYAGFAGLQALSTGPCRPYSRSDGLNLGEGAAFLLLEPLDLALARGAVPLAEVAGYGLSADAYHATAPDPTGRGGAAAVRRALAAAGLSPQDVHYVSGHGTGTPANDAMEAKVMRLAFGERAGQVPTSSIKSFLGHTLGAAGAVEAVAGVLALRHGVAPPTIGFDTEPGDAPATDLDFVPNVARPMTIETVVSNNYAFGGNNVSLVLTRPREPRPYEELPRREAVITGLGPVTGAGTGIAEVSAAISAGRRAAGRAPSLDGRTYAPRSLWRHMNHLSRMAIAASRLAWEDAGLKLPRKALDDVGLIFATGAGSSESTGGFDQSIALNPNKPAVLSFSNVVLNATGGAVCQTLGLRGPTTTICNGGASASIALDCALELIRAGKAEVVLVVAADERAGGPTGYADQDGVVPTPYEAGAAEPVPGSAAVAFVVESAEHCAERGGRPYAQVLGTSHAPHHPTDTPPSAEAQMAADTPLSTPPDARPHTQSDAADAASAADAGGAVGRGIAAFAGAAPGVVVGAAQDEREAAAVLAMGAGGVLTSSAALIGDCQAASGAMNIALGALAVRDGIAPALDGLTRPVAGEPGRYLTDPALPEPVAQALALTAAPGSVYGAVLLGGGMSGTPPFDVAETDRLLTTTRSVRRRLDLDRPVPREVILEALDVAVQAPTANNHQNWRWLVITDPAVKLKLAEMIRSSWTFHRNDIWTNAGRRRNDAQAKRNYASAHALTETLEAVPALVIPCVLGRPPDVTAINEAWRARMADKADEDPGHLVRHGETRASIFYGSIFPAIWSFQLALRSRGLGSTITCLHVPHERQVGQLLSIPTGVTQVCMIPVAYTLGTDFRPADRHRAAERTYWERWGELTHMVEQPDVVIIGGGIAGASAACKLAAGGLSVVLLEKQDAYKDLVRGEWLAPWGIREARRLGVDECFWAGGGWEIREWMTWDEAVTEDEVEAVDMTGFIPGIGGPMSFPHHAVCELMSEQAVQSGARLEMAASKIDVTPGPRPVVSYRTPDGPRELRPRIVLGATGRGCTVGRQAGITMRNSMHHWGGGMMVEGMDAWPPDVQAMGTEGDRMFMVFPQGYGRARLYLNFPTVNKHRYRGPGGVARFLAAFELECLPDRGKAVTEAIPAGPLSVWPSVSSVPEGPPMTEGVVLIGDEAGNADTVLGTGLSCALRDSRTVCDILLGSADWSPPAFAPYAEERAFRIERLDFGASIISRLHVEFGPAAVERRRRVRKLMAKNFAAQVTGLLNMVAPEEVPEFGFSEFFAERLFRETA